MVCTSCQTVVLNESHFCSNRGASLLDGAAEVAGDADRWIGALLAEANLFRMRAMWHEAESRCIDVMRSSPNDVHAHSLLGDIYRDQGRYDDAGKWYQMALDLNPQSAADRSKLAHVEQIRQKARHDQSPATSVGGPGAVSGTQRLIGLPPSTWLRALTALSVLFLVVVAALLISMRERASGNRAPDSSADTITVHVPKPGGPHENGSPVPLAKAPKPAQGNVMSGADQGAETGVPSGSTTPDSNKVRGNLTDRELSLQNYISTKSGLGSGTAVAAVSLDSRGQAAAILLTHTPHETSPDRIKLEIAQVAINAARAAFSAEPALQKASLNVRIANETGHLEPAFNGDLSRVEMQSILPTWTPDQIFAAFANAWWAPGFASSGSQTGQELPQFGGGG